MASMASQAQTSEDAVYRAFTGVLTSGDKITLSLHTVRQAVSHFLSTRPLSDLKELVSASLAADIWSGDDAEEALTLVKATYTEAATLRKSREAEASRSSLLGGLAVDRRLRRWFERVEEALRQTPRIDLVIAARSGLLAGTAGSEDSLRVARGNVEDEIVMRLGDQLEGFNPQSDLSIVAIAEAVIELPPWKVQLLADMGLRDVILASTVPPESSTSPESSKTSHPPHADLLGRALAHSFRKSASQPSRKGKERAWSDMEKFAASSRSTAVRLEGGDDVVSMNLLKVFLEVGNVVIDELSRNQPPAPSERKRRPLKISTDLLLTLGALQPIGTPENPLKVIPMYDEVMYGCLDIVVATGSEADLIGILEEILKLNLQGDAAAFHLLVAEQFITSLSMGGIRRKVLPFCQSQLDDVKNGEAMTAAHSVILAILAQCPQFATEATSRAWVRSTINWYAPLVIEHTLQGHLTGEQSKAAYKAVAQVAAAFDAHLSMTLLNLLIDKLRLMAAARDSAGDAIATSRLQYLRLNFIGCLPYVPASALSSILHDTVKPMLLSLPVASADRSELCQALYDVIGGGLGDQAKIVGYGFWLDWRDRLVGERAKL